MIFSLQHNCCDLFSQLDFKSITVQHGEKHLTQNFPDVFDKKPFPKKSLLLTSQENECPRICCCGGPDHSSLFSSEMNVPGLHAVGYLPLFARVEGKFIHSCIKFCAEVI